MSPGSSSGRERRSQPSGLPCAPWRESCRAGPDKGTRCSVPCFVVAPGLVQTPSLRSNCPIRAARTSPERAPVSSAVGTCRRPAGRCVIGRRREPPQLVRRQVSMPLHFLIALRCPWPGCRCDVPADRQREKSSKGERLPGSRGRARRVRRHLAVQDVDVGVGNRRHLARAEGGQHIVLDDLGVLLCGCSAAFSESAPSRT